MSDNPPQVSPVDSFDDTNPKWPKVIGIKLAFDETNFFHW